MALAPIQMIASLLATPDVSATETTGAGSGVTEIVRVVVALQPLALVTVTV